ncbi:MAG: hypothetical protein IPH16_11145 [Haliscomenobacter sp.]|nr:hypothetical protein [Haliscomenobacter sp.]MBK7474731.1 hypothetical protein [Haliscomenobacter sp.]MBK8877619.1 hypothetical protein [Haliscomenobacter sp.]
MTNYKQVLFFGLVFVAGLLRAQESIPSAWPRQSSGWSEFLSVEGGFKVLSPAGLRERADTIPTPLGNLVYHTFHCKESADIVYMVSYCDYPEYTIHQDSVDMLQEFFKATMEQAAFSVEGEIAYQEDQDVLGYPGKVWRINSPKSKSVIRTRAFVAGSRYYAVQTVMMKGESLNPSSERFLESFRLLL